MDPEPRVVHTAQCDEDPALWPTPGSKHICEIAAILLPQRLLIVESSHHYGSDLDQLDHMAKHAGP
jgi:hypothetical protein